MRKIIDVWPVLSVTPEQSGRCWTKDEALAAYREVNEALKHLQTPSRFRLNIGFNFQEDARCEHCNGTWTEDDHAYNGGCCAKDEANDPVRLASLRTLADECGADLYRVDEYGGRSRNTCDWPWALATATRKWLNAGRPADGVGALLPLIERVDSSEWCTVWSDPGDYPSNAGSGPLPDQVSTATEPNELASDLRRLIDDMGLAPAKAVA